MISLRCLSALCLFATCVPFTAHGQELHKTDAQLDGLSGPVQSVSSLSMSTDVNWQQPNGPTLVEPIWCRDCQYDRDGTKLVSGQLTEGTFYGGLIQLVHDDAGRVRDRYLYNAYTAELERHDVMGYVGVTEQKIYVGGKFHSRSIFGYDQNGNQNEWRSFDRSGASTGYTLTVSAKDGSLLRSSSYDKNGLLSHEQTYDPDTDTVHFTTYDEFDKVKLTWTVVQGKLTSFWRLSGSSDQYGDNFTEPEGEGSFDRFACHSDLQCDVSHIHYEYLDRDKHLPLSAEWRDAEGKLQLASYFEYDVDSYHNWTRRVVWVWNPNLAERTLLETDVRAISYWNQ